MQAGGAGKAMAEWITAGAPEWDLWSLDPRRYTEYANQAQHPCQGTELYQNEYAIAFPFEERLAGGRPDDAAVRDAAGEARDVRRARRLGARGVVRARGGGAEQRPSFHRTDWFAAVGEECRAVRERVGVLDLGGFAKFEVSGEACRRLPGPADLRPAAEARTRGACLHVHAAAAASCRS